MHISGLNVRITLQKNQTVVDGIGNHIDEWTDYFSCYATVSDKSGDEELAAGQTKVNERMDFTIRYSSETKVVTADEYRIILGDRIYNITSVDDMAFKHRSIKLHAERERGGNVKSDTGE